MTTPRETLPWEDSSPPITAEQQQPADIAAPDIAAPDSSRVLLSASARPSPDAPAETVSGWAVQVMQPGRAPLNFHGHQRGEGATVAAAELAGLIHTCQNLPCGQTLHLQSASANLVHWLSGTWTCRTPALKTALKALGAVLTERNQTLQATHVHAPSADMATVRNTARAQLNRGTDHVA